MSATQNSVKAEHLHIRTSQRDKTLLARAAHLKNLSISQFLLQSALPVAEKILEDQDAQAQDFQTVFRLNDQAWQEFTRLLDAPPRELPALRALLSSRPVWKE